MALTLGRREVTAALVGGLVGALLVLGAWIALEWKGTGERGHDASAVAATGEVAAHDDAAHYRAALEALLAAEDYSLERLWTLREALRRAVAAGRVSLEEEAELETAMSAGVLERARRTAAETREREGLP